MHRLETFHQSCLRRILRVRYFHHVTNEEILRRTSLLRIRMMIGIRRLRWYGHVVRMPDGRLQKYLLDWQPRHGKRSAGAQRITWIKCVQDDLDIISGIEGATHQQGIVMAKDRKAWGAMLRKARDIEFEQPDPHMDGS